MKRTCLALVALSFVALVASDGVAAPTCGDSEGEGSSLLQVTSEVTARAGKIAPANARLPLLEVVPASAPAATTVDVPVAPTCSWQRRLVPISLVAGASTLTLLALVMGFALMADKMDMVHALLCLTVANNNIATTVTMVESHRLAMSINMSTSWSGFSVGVPRFGQFVATIIAWIALNFNGWEYWIKSQLVLAMLVTFVGAVIYTLVTLQAASNLTLVGGLALWVIAARVFSGLGAGVAGQVARCIVPLVTPPEEKVYRGVRLHLSAMFGLGLGPFLVAWLSIFDPCPGLSPDYLVGGPAWILIALVVLIVVAFCFPPIGEEINAQIEADHGKASSNGNGHGTEDRILVTLTLVSSFMRMVVSSGLEVGTALFLEKPYGWSHTGIGMFAGSVCLLVIPGASLHERAKSINPITFGTLLALLCTFGCVLLFDLWQRFGTVLGLGTLIVGECLLFPALWLGDAILVGYRSAALGAPGTAFDSNNVNLYSHLVVHAGLFIGPYTSRLCIEMGGRDAYATYMLIMVLVVLGLTQLYILPRVQSSKK